MIFKTTYQKQAAFITTLFMALVLFLMFFCGLRYLDPPEEYGVAINFGTSEDGLGSPKQNKSIKSNPVESKKISVEKEIVTQKSATQEKVLTQNNEEAPVIEEKKNPPKEIVKIEKKKVVEKKNKADKKEVIKKKPTPNKETQNILDNLFGNPSKGEAAQSEGDGNGEGVKGKISGDPDSDKYYGNDGLGGEGNYLLKGRRALSTPKRKPNCNEEGIVVVRIEVDTNGKVIRAVPGVKGTTNNSPCLLEPAKKAALATPWNPDGNAPSKQVGIIRYQFILSE